MANSSSDGVGEVVERDSVIFQREGMREMKGRRGITNAQCPINEFAVPFLICLGQF